MAVKDGVFISYSRKDGKETADEIRKKLQARHIKVWQDIIEMEGGQDWWHQITDALDKVSFMVLIATPGAMASPIVRKEWRYARQQGVCVYPILVPGNHPDFSEMQRWMRDIHFYDMANPAQEVKFFHDISGSCQFVKVPQMAGPLPDDYVERTEQMETILSLLLSQSRDEPVAITAALRGAGGYGKTVIAQAICHNEAVQAAFDDGILWVTLGENPGEPTEKLLNLIGVLTNERPSFTDVESARTRFQEVVADRDLLIVIDDVWRSQDVEPFLKAGPRCAYLITTRDDSTLPRQVKKVRVDSMSPEEAIQLLISNLKKEPEFVLTPEINDELKRLAKLLGNWALLIKLARGAMEEEFIDYKRTIDQAIYGVRRSLETYGLSAFDPEDIESTRMAVQSTLGASLNRLSTAELARFYELGIFPEDVAVPLKAIERLWKTTGDYNEIDTERLCRRLNRLSLLLDLELSHADTPGFLRLHDVVRAYLRDKAEPHLPDIAATFLDTYNVARWANLEESEDYLWDHLAYHLIEARRYDELISTVNDLEYVAKKLFFRNSSAVEADIQVALNQVDNTNRTSLLISRTLAQISDFLAKCLSPAEILTNLFARMPQVSDEHITTQDRFTIQSIHPFPDTPHSAMQRVITSPMQGETHANSCIFPDQKTVFVNYMSAKSDDSLASPFRHEALARFNIQSGKLLQWLDLGNIDEQTRISSCEVSHTGKWIAIGRNNGVVELRDSVSFNIRWQQEVYGATEYIVETRFSPDDQFLTVIGSKKFVLPILSVATGSIVSRLAGYTSSINEARFSISGDTVLTASADGTVKRWSVSSGELIDTIHIETNERYIWSMCLTSNDRFAVFGYGNGDLQYFDLHERRSLWLQEKAHSKGITTMDISADGQYVITGSNDTLTKVWKIETRENLYLFRSHRDRINRAQFIQSKSLSCLSTSKDGTLRLWDLHADIQPSRTTENVHDSYVTSCEFSADGKLLVTASEDKTMRVWDTRHGSLVSKMEEHRALLPDCTISPIGFTAISISSDPRKSDNRLRSFDTLTGQMLESIEPTELTAPSSTDWPTISETTNSTLNEMLKRLSELLPQSQAAKVSSSAWLQSVQYSPDGSKIAVGTADLMGGGNTVRILEWPSKTVLVDMVGHEAPIYDCTFSPNGLTLASASSDNSVRLWDVDTGKLQHTLLGHTDSVFGCRFSPDGKQLLSASADWTLRLWDIESGEIIRVFEGHENAVWDCAFNQDASLCISVSEDRTLKLWDVQTGKTITTLYTEGFLLGCDWHLQSDLIAAVGERGVYLMRLVTPEM